MYPNQPHPGDDPPDPSADAIPRLTRGQLHEVHATADDWPCAIAFALAMSEAESGHPLLLLRVRKGRSRSFTTAMVPCGEGWTALGLDPARLVIVDALDDAGLLRAGLDAAREGGLGAVLIESWGHLRPYDLVASRRLILAAETSRIPIVVLRGDAEPRASAAHTRWNVASAPSVPLEMRAPGPPALLVELTRQRGGPAGRRWRLEWSENDGAFRDIPLGIGSPTEYAGENAAPLPGAVVSLPAVRARPPLRRIA
jgi:protein ImuA